MPTEIISRWIHAHGKEQTTEACWTSQWRPVTVLRPNRLKTDGPGLVATLAQEDIAAEYDEASDSVFLATGSGAAKSQAFREGLFQMQDVTAQQAVRMAELKPGMTVLDLATGVGTKATQAAEVMGNRGRVLAHDIAEGRLKKIAGNCRRLGLTVVETVRPNELEGVLDEIDRIDVILVDAPCSNSGVLAPARSEISFYAQVLGVVAQATGGDTGAGDSAGGRADTRGLQYLQRGGGGERGGDPGGGGQASGLGRVRQQTLPAELIGAS